MKRLFIGIIVLTLFTHTAIAQAVAPVDADDADNDDPYETLSYVMFGVNYLTDNVYLGRKDSVAVPYLSPYVGYHLRSGLYAKGMMSFATVEKDRSSDLVTMEAGYDHSFGGHFNSGVSVDQFFYGKNSTSIRSATQQSASVYGQYSNKWLEPQVNVFYNINKSSTDHALGFQIDHNFGFIKNTLTFIPTIAMNGGTQNYYDEYFKRKLTKRDKKAKVDKTVVDAQKFKPLDYEFSINSTYRVSKWLFTFIPTYVIPLSPSILALPKSSVKEKLSNTFFVEIDICHR